MLSLHRFLALVVIAAAAVNGLVGGGAAAQAGQVAHAAAHEPSLRVGVRAGDPLAPEVLLTNTGNTPCQVAATTLGTLSITLLEQGGTVVDPTYFDAAFTDGLDLAVQRRLQTLAPGAMLTLAIPVRPIGPTGHALETVAAAASGPIGAFYPVNPGQALRLEVGYAVPVPVEGATPVCQVAPAAASARPAAPGDGGAGGPAWLRWVLIAVAVVIAVLLLLTLLRMLMHRGSGKAGTAAKPKPTPDPKSGESAKPGDAGKPADSAKPGEAATAEAPASTDAVPGTPDATTTGTGSASGTGAGPGAGLVVLALAAAMLVGYDWNTAARAEIVVDPSLASAWDSCSATLHGPGGDPAGILPALEAPGVTVSIIPANGDETHEGAISRVRVRFVGNPS